MNSFGTLVNILAISLMKSMNSSKSNEVSENSKLTLTFILSKEKKTISNVQMLVKFLYKILSYFKPQNAIYICIIYSKDFFRGSAIASIKSEIKE